MWINVTFDDVLDAEAVRLTEGDCSALGRALERELGCNVWATRASHGRCFIEDEYGNKVWLQGIDPECMGEFDLALPDGFGRERE